MITKIQNTPQRNNFGMKAGMQLKRTLIKAYLQEETSPEFAKINPQDTVRVKSKQLLARWAKKAHTENLIIDFEPYSFVLGQKIFIITENKKYTRLATMSDDGSRTVTNLKSFPSRKLQFLPQAFEEGQDFLAAKYLLDFNLKDFSKILTE